MSAQLAPSQLTVFAGLHDRSNLEHKQWQLRKVAKIRIHPNFKHETEHADIALLTLDKQIEIDQFVNAVCVTKHLANPNSHCYATGYGVEDKKGKGEITIKKVHFHK